MDAMDHLRLCRLCLCTSECFIDIFGENVGLGFNVEKTIEDLLQLQVIKVEGIPSLACSTCIKELNQFRIFKSRCVDSKDTFEKRLCLIRRRPGRSNQNHEGNVNECNFVDDNLKEVTIATEKCGRTIKSQETARNVIEGPGIVSSLTEIDSEVDVALDIVKVENDSEENASKNSRGIYQKGLSLSGDGGFALRCGDWNREEVDEMEADDDGTDRTEVMSVVVVKTESLAEEDDGYTVSETQRIPQNARDAVLLDRYTKEDLTRAIEEVRAGNPIRVIGRAYGIPESTIRRRLSVMARQSGLRHACGTEVEHADEVRLVEGRDDLTSVHERKLTNFVRGLRASGKGVDARRLRNLAHRYMRSKKGSPASDGEDWFDSFLDRLTVSVPEKVSVKTEPEVVPRRVPNHGYEEVGGFRMLMSPVSPEISLQGTNHTFGAEEANSRACPDVGERLGVKSECYSDVNGERCLSDYIVGLIGAYGPSVSSYEIRQRAYDHAQAQGLPCRFGRMPCADNKDWLDEFLEGCRGGVVTQEFTSTRAKIVSTARKMAYTEGDMLEAVNAVMSGRPIRQVGREMGIAESTIRMRIKRMRSSLSR